jgi:hypothetical protein
VLKKTKKERTRTDPGSWEKDRYKKNIDKRLFPTEGFLYSKFFF